MAKSKDVEVLTEEEIAVRGKAIDNLHGAMNGLMTAVIQVDDAGIKLADAFEAIGMEIPKFLQPMVNQLADKLPSRNPDFVRSDT